MSASPATSGSDACCMITSRGPPLPRCLVTTTRQMMCRVGCTSRSGPGTDSSLKRRLTIFESLFWCEEESVKIKCFACDALIEADDSDAVTEAFEAHGRESHTWSYPPEAIRNYARNYAE